MHPVRSSRRPEDVEFLWGVVNAPVLECCGDGGSDVEVGRDGRIVHPRHVGHGDGISGGGDGSELRVDPQREVHTPDEEDGGEEKQESPECFAQAVADGGAHGVGVLIAGFGGEGKRGV